MPGQSNGWGTTRFAPNTSFRLPPVIPAKAGIQRPQMKQPCVYILTSKWKLESIERDNPEWQDLYEGLA